MTAVAGGARHDPRILTAGMQGRRGCLQAFRGPRRRSPGVLTTTAHPATTNPLSLSLPLSEHSTSTRRGRYEFPDALFPPPLSSIKQINAPSGFFSSFSRDVGGVVPFCGKEGRKEVEGRFSLLMD